MQSWGTRSRWDVRDTGLAPTKSGIIGLIGCALGMHRDDPGLERLDREVLFAVRIDRAGVVSTDYHTVTGHHRTAAGEFKHSGGTSKSLAKAHQHGESTIVSPRDYLHDAAFLVALASKEPLLLARIAGELDHPDWFGDLRRPKWPLYLGRKACVPSRPVFDRLTTEYDDPEAAIRSEPLSEQQTNVEPPNTLEGWIEAPGGEYERQDAMRLNQLRFYDFRRCNRIEIDTSKLPRRTA